MQSAACHDVLTSWVDSKFGIILKIHQNADNNYYYYIAYLVQPCFQALPLLSLCMHIYNTGYIYYILFTWKLYLSVGVIVKLMFVTFHSIHCSFSFHMQCYRVDILWVHHIVFWPTLVSGCGYNLWPNFVTRRVSQFHHFGRWRSEFWGMSSIIIHTSIYSTCFIAQSELMHTSCHRPWYTLA